MKRVKKDEVWQFAKEGMNSLMDELIVITFWNNVYRRLDAFKKNIEIEAEEKIKAIEAEEKIKAIEELKEFLLRKVREIEAIEEEYETKLNAVFKSLNVEVPVYGTGKEGAKKTK